MPPDEYLGPYLIGELLGRGGMGNVYRGTHAKTGDRVAVKLIAAHVSDDPRFRRRFDREIRALKMLRHPGIVRIIGEGEDDHGRLFYSMELIEGETLQARIRRLKKLPWQDVIDIGIEICSALKHAHDIGVTHRDLKPANLIFTADGKVKLVDFGIPKVFGDHGDQTQAGSILGTPDYMAPEQASGEPITPRTDIYSLGSVMYACLVGRAPFKGKNSTEVIDAVRRERPIPLELVDPELPMELIELVHQMLEKDPDKRPPTALSAMKRLKSMRAGLQHQATISLEDSVTDIGGTCELSDRSDDTTAGEGGRSGFDSSPVGMNPLLDDDSSDRTLMASSATEATSPRSPKERTVSGKSAKTVRPGELSPRTESASASASASPTDAPETSPATRARFSTVLDTHDSGRLFDASPSSKSTSLRHALTVAAMVTALIGFAFLAYQSTRPATADQLYDAVVSTNSLVSMEAFLRRFPDDDRADDVMAMRMQKRIATTVRRLNAQKSIGLKPLSPAEEGFIATMSERYTDPDNAVERLSHWIDAFGADESTNESVAELGELARYEQSRLKSPLPSVAMDERATVLINEIRSAMDTLDNAAATKKLRGIVETFKGVDWAKPAVKEARRLLPEE